MKKRLIPLIILCLFLFAFSATTKPPRYFIGEAHFNNTKSYLVVTIVIRANYFKDAGDIFFGYLKKNYDISKIIKWDDGRPFQITEIDFDNILH